MDGGVSGSAAGWVGVAGAAAGAGAAPDFLVVADLVFFSYGCTVERGPAPPDAGALPNGVLVRLYTLDGPFSR